jgi:hypothetical protein
VEQVTTNTEEEGLVELLKETLPDGKTKIVYTNGDRYEGEVEKGQKSGWGSYYYSNNEKYIGCFVED